MKMRTLLILLYIVFLTSQPAYAMGLSTTFGRVKIDNITIGQAYSMEKDAKTPFELKNTSDRELLVKVDVLIPREGELVEGYEPIPDTDWITLEEDNFIVPPEGKASTDIIINIPEDGMYKGKKYQVYIWSYTIDESINIGIKSKLLISIAE